MFNRSYTCFRTFLLSAVIFILAGCSGSDTSSLSTTLPTGSSVLLPKTGQTTSYATGDDGALQKGTALPSPRFTDNADGTVTDNLTGLIWLKNANCSATIAGISNTGESLPWASAMTWSNGLASGACGLTDGSTAGQWRLPNKIELQSLLSDHSAADPPLPIGHPFTEVQLPFYWTSSTYAGVTGGAWSVDTFQGGTGTSVNRFGDPFVWPVRSGKSAATITLPRTGQTTSYATGDDGALQIGTAWPSPRFTDNANGTVTDNLTRLIWLKNASCTDKVGLVNPITGGKLPWSTAITWSNGLQNGNCGLSDGSTAGQWRLPNIKELESLIDLNSVNPPLTTGYPFTRVQYSDYWSSSTVAGDTGSAWDVYMQEGTSNSYDKRYNSFVWPVRSGQ